MKNNAPTLFYHCTRLDAFKGIVSGHKGKLSFWMFRSDQMNDKNELKWVYKNCFGAKKDLKPSYILSLSTNRNFAVATNLEYGNITLVMKSSIFPIDSIKMQQCVYTDAKCPKVKSKNIFEKIINSFAVHVRGHFVKGTSWAHEEEWRLVENAQIGEVPQVLSSTQREYIVREFPLEGLIAVLIFQKEGEDVEGLRNEVKKALDINGSTAELQIRTIKLQESNKKVSTMMKNILYGSISLFFIVLTVCAIFCTANICRDKVTIDYDGLTYETKATSSYNAARIFHKFYYTFSKAEEDEQERQMRLQRAKASDEDE